MAKKEKTKIQLQPKDVATFFERYHAGLFTILVGGGLAVCVFMLMNIFNHSSAPDNYTPTSINTTFDTQTIKRVENLTPITEQPAEPSPVNGRTDPFSG